MIRAETLSPSEWELFAENAHLACFNEHRPKDFNRIDFALLAFHHEKAVSYMTCRELDPEMVYMQYGGSFDLARNTVISFKSYEAMIQKLSEKYKYATTYIQNTNTAMLKFAMRVGLRIIGCRTFKGEVFLEHFMEFNRG